MNIGAKIIEIRKKGNMTQEDFAKIFHVTRQTVSNWENQKSYPDLQTLVQISDEFDISLDTMLKEDMSMVKKIDNFKIYKKAFMGLTAGILTIGILGCTYIGISKVQHNNMYNKVESAGFTKELTENFIEKYNGYLITSLVCSEDISKTYVAKYIKEHGMEKVSRGLYITDDVWPDELFILQQRNGAIIYSGETALYLHGLTDREYSSVCVTVPQGYNASHLKDNDFNVSVKYAAPDLYKIGICEIASSSGNLVKVYDKERCICDLIMNRNKYEVQVFQTAIKEYMSSKDKKLSQLIVYADMMGIRDEVMKYVEVLV